MSKNETDLARKVGPKDCRTLVEACMKAGRAAMIWGPPGIGKSDIIRQIAKDMEKRSGEYVHVHDIRLLLKEPTDLRGIPYRNSETNRMDWSLPTDLPEPDTATHKTPPNIVFLDELTAAPQSVQAAAYQLILDRKIGTYSLPASTLLIAAGNRVSDKGVAFKMPTPLANRFVHFEMETRFDDWAYWAVANRVHPDVMGYLGEFKSHLFQFNPKSSDRAFPTPRSWAFVSDLLWNSGLPMDLLPEGLAGCIGTGMSTQFVAYRKIFKTLPKISDILNGTAKPLKNNEPSAQYALSAGLCYELSDTYAIAKEKKKLDEWNKSANNYLGYLMDNFRRELVVMSLRTALKVYEIPFSMQQLSNWDRFYKEYGKLITEAV